MKHSKILTTITVILLSQMSVVYAQDTEINNLNVNTENKVTGNVKATDGSKINIGDTNIQNVQADKVTNQVKNTITGDVTSEGGSTVSVGNLDIKDSTNLGTVDLKNRTNETDTIKATNGGTVSIGNVDIEGVDGGNITVTKMKNEIRGTTEADGENSIVSVGDIKIKNTKGTDITIDGENSIGNGIEAKNGGSVKVGTVSVQNTKGGSVNYTGKNTVNGKITSDGDESEVSIGNLDVQ